MDYLQKEKEQLIKASCILQKCSGNYTQKAAHLALPHQIQIRILNTLEVPEGQFDLGRLLGRTRSGSPHRQCTYHLLLITNVGILLDVFFWKNYLVSLTLRDLGEIYGLYDQQNAQ